MVDKILGTRKYFKLLFIVYVFTNTLALGYFGITFNPLCLIVMGYGILIIGYELYKKELIYSRNHLLLMGLYSLLLMIATYLNKDYSNKYSYIVAFMQILIVFLLFGQPRSMTLKTLKKELQSIIPLTSILVGIASFISLGTYFFNISGERNGWYFGLVGSRLFGVYFNCNPASFLAVIVILLSLIAIKNNYKGKILYIINIFIQLGYIILTQCRAAIIILAVIITSVIYYYFFRSKEITKIKKICINIVLCSSILFGTVIINEVAFFIPKLQGAIEKDDIRFQFSKVKEIITLTMTGEIQNIPRIVTLADEVSSGRITLAKDSIKVWEKSPIHGIGASNFRTMLVDVTNDNTWGQQILHTHNVFVESLVTCGIFGFLLFILFFIKSLFTTRDVLIKYKNKKSYYIILLFIMIYVSEFIGGLLDFGIFYVYSLSATLAWIFLGYIYWLNDQSDMSLIDDTSLAVFDKYELLSMNYYKEDINILKPKFIILDAKYSQNDYILKVKYVLGQSSFVYNIYYSLKDNAMNIEELNNILVRDFFYLVQDEINDIYKQSHIK